MSSDEMDMDTRRYTGRGDSFVIATTDSPGRCKDQADRLNTSGGVDVDILAAINELTSGGCIKLMPGSYSVAGLTSITTDGIYIAGSGKKNTILTLDSGADCSMFKWGDGGTTTVYRGGLYDIELQGNKANNASTSYGVLFDTDCKEMDVYNIWAADFNDGGIFQSDAGSTGEGSHFLRVINSTISSCETYGIYNGNNNNDLIVLGCKIGAGTNGIQIEGGLCKIENNILINNSNIHVINNGNSNSIIGNSMEYGDYGITGEGNHSIYSLNKFLTQDFDGIYLGHNVSGLVINSNQFQTPSRHGIWVYNLDTTALTINSNNFFGSVQDTIRLSGCHNITLNGNNIHNPGTGTDNNYAGIRIDQRSEGNDCSDIHINNNTILSESANKMRYGIYVQDADQTPIHANNNMMVGAQTAVHNIPLAGLNIINNLGYNVGNPGSTGNWNGHGEEGIMVLDTTGNVFYRYANGAWRAV